MEYDLKIVGAEIIDGTGAPRFAGDVAVKDGIIIAIGDAPGEAAETIEARGKIVSPGFIDCHTHYDAQVFWDPAITPSSLHGVTTVLSGNCGFTLAPLSGRKEDADYLIAMLSRVEGMPLASLELAVRPSWTTFGEYLDLIDGTTAINVAFLVGHSALRRTVMGERAVGEKATGEDIERMAALLRQSLEQGGAGFSTTISPSHSDHNGDAVPSRWADDEEIVTLARQVKDFAGTWLELLPAMGGDGLVRSYDLAAEMSLAGQCAVNWNSVVVTSQRPEMLEAQLEMGRQAARRGAKVYGLVPAVAIKNVINFRTGLQLELMEGWHAFIHQPDEAKLEAMRDPDVRRRLREGQARSWMYSGLAESFAPFLLEFVSPGPNSHWTGRTVAEYAEAVDKDPFDALFDLALEEDLMISFSAPAIGDDAESWKLRGKAWRDDYILIGASDAGAHIDANQSFAISTQLLGEGVRDRKMLTLEEAVRRMTGYLAEIFGLKDRGRIELGAAADLVVFDPDTVGCGPITMRGDLPGGEVRLYADSVGVHHVIVNGVVVARDSALTGQMGGKVLRRGRDTASVPLDKEICAVPAD